MENYVLYDEVGRGEHSVVYKGRKKGSIEFVAIHCVEKCKRYELQNIVRLTHELDHRNVVKFYEWYETTNHIWMVVEFCTGGSLRTIISQDSVLPEKTVKEFGVELVKGLHFLHSLGILFCDLRPSRILLDGPGILKLADFALARIEGEDDFYSFQDDDEYDSDNREHVYRGSTTTKRKRPKASPQYMAPEVIQGEPHSKESDLWSLGCLLFELFTGKPPFVAETFAELTTKIFHDDFAELKQIVGKQVIKSSETFKNLVRKLLVKDASTRLNWLGLVNDAFWEGELDGLLDHKEESVDSLDELIHNKGGVNGIENLSESSVSDKKLKMLMNRSK